MFAKRIRALGACFSLLALVLSPAMAIVQDSATPHTGSEDYLILRNLTRIDSQRIEEFDSHSLRLSAGMMVSWDDVLELPRSHPKFDEMNSLLSQFGEPFFRLKQRLRAGDWKRAGEIAHRLSEQFSNDSSEYGLWVNAALFKMHLASGDREAAVGPWLEIVKHPERNLTSNPEFALLNFVPDELDGGVNSDLWPIFFDSEAALGALKELSDDRAESASENNVTDPARVVYTAGLMAALGDNGITLKDYLANTDWSGDQLQPWKHVFQLASGSQQPLPGDRLGDPAIQMTTSGIIIRPIASYWLVRRRQSVDSTPTIETALAYLDIAANGSPGGGDLAAAAIWEASEILERLDRTEESNRLREELSRIYALTYHGRKLSGRGQIR